MSTPQLEKILQFRNDELRERNSLALRQIATETRNENEIMTKHAENSVRDSKLLKALTMLATMYLPATLFAVGLLDDGRDAAYGVADCFQLQSGGTSRIRRSEKVNIPDAEQRLLDIRRFDA
jgi:hypothetical protein